MQGFIPWEWIEDRLRKTRSVPMWDNARQITDTAVQAYRRNIWTTQPRYVHVWPEKMH